MAGHIWLSPCSGGPEFKARTWKGHRKVGCKKKKEWELHSNSIGHWTMQISMENNVHLHLDTSLVFHFRCPFNGGNSVELGVGTKKSSWGYALGNTSSWLACWASTQKPTDGQPLNALAITLIMWHPIRTGVLAPQPSDPFNHAIALPNFPTLQAADKWRKRSQIFNAENTLGMPQSTAFSAWI